MGSMMAKRKAEKEARRAAGIEELKELGTVPEAPRSAPAKRRAAPTRSVQKPSKRRRTMNATMDGPADEIDYDLDIVSASASPSLTGRKMSEYERFQQIASPQHATSGKRGRRPAALRASQSFSRFADDGDDEDEEEEESEVEQERLHGERQENGKQKEGKQKEKMQQEHEEEDVDQEIKKQFDSEYDHFQALTSPDPIPGVLTGKRKRKPVINLAEAMRIEAGDDDDLLLE